MRRMPVPVTEEEQILPRAMFKRIWTNTRPFLELLLKLANAPGSLARWEDDGGACLPTSCGDGRNIAKK